MAFFACLLARFAGSPFFLKALSYYRQPAILNRMLVLHELAARHVAGVGRMGRRLATCRGAGVAGEGREHGDWCMRDLLAAGSMRGDL